MLRSPSLSVPAKKVFTPHSVSRRAGAAAVQQSQAESSLLTQEEGLRRSAGDSRQAACAKGRERDRHGASGTFEPRTCFIFQRWRKFLPKTPSISCIRCLETTTRPRWLPSWRCVPVSRVFTTSVAEACSWAIPNSFSILQAVQNADICHTTQQTEGVPMEKAYDRGTTIFCCLSIQNYQVPVVARTRLRMEATYSSSSRGRKSCSLFRLSNTRTTAAVFCCGGV